MAFCEGMSRPGQLDSVQVAERRVQGGALEVKRKGEEVKHHRKPPCGARPSRMPNRFQGQAIEGIKASSGLLQGSIMCQDNGGIRDRWGTIAV